jgi:hypothetical protein
MMPVVTTVRRFCPPPSLMVGNGAPTILGLERLRDAPLPTLPPPSRQSLWKTVSFGGGSRKPNSFHRAVTRS